MMFSTFRGRASVIGVSAVAVLSALGVASIASSDSGHVAQSGAATSQARTDTLRQYGVLQDASRNATGGTLSKAQGQLAQAFDITSAESVQTRAAVAHEDDASQVVVAAMQTKGVCLSVRDRGTGSGSFGCTDTAYAGDASKPLIAVDSIGDGQARVTALLVDGISSLTVVDRDGSHETKVFGNVATTVVDSGPITLSWVAPDGTEHQLSTTAS